MPKDQLVNYYVSLQSKWESDLKVALKHSGSASIHDARVDTKRLRAFLKLIAIVDKDFDAAPALDSLKRPFKAAGRVRHFQIQMDLTRRHIDSFALKLDWYYNHLKAQEISVRRKFKKKCADLDRRSLDAIPRKLRRILSQYSHDEIATKIARRVESLMSELRSMNRQSASADSDYHAIRILAKETRYTLEILRKYAGDSKGLEQMDGVLTGLHQALGAWHDCDIAVKELASVQPGIEEADYICLDSLNRFNASLSTERDLQLELFRSRWTDYFGPAASEPHFKLDALETKD